MTASAAPPAGSLVRFHGPTGRARFGIMLSVDRDTHDWWLLGLQHPHRRLRLLPDELDVIAEPGQFRQVLEHLADEATTNDRPPSTSPAGFDL